MQVDHIAVIDWPDHHAIRTQWAGKAPCVIRIDAPFSNDRGVARRQTRAALAEALAVAFDCAKEKITLRTVPGHAPSLIGHDVGISLTHAPGMSLAAMHPTAAVGVDLLHLPSSTLPPAELAQLAHDYLDPQARQRIVAAPSSTRARVFAREWTAQEAGLKCLGQSLTEWSTAPQQRLRAVQRARLILPDDWVGTVCWSAY